MKNKKYSITLQGHNTSITLEPLFWEVLKSIARNKNITLPDLITEIDMDRLIPPPAERPNLSSAIRLYVIHKLLEDNDWLRNH